MLDILPRERLLMNLMDLMANNDEVCTMKSGKYYFSKVMCRLLKSQAPMEKFYRRGGIKLGNNCLICSYIMTKEPFLLEIGDNVIISTNVSFVTHDRSPKIWNGWGDLYGRIKIGSNSFIGENATILYGVELPQNSLVAAGSVVTKSFSESYLVLAGNPAKVIGHWDGLKDKYHNKIVKRKDMIRRIKENDESFLVYK